MRTLRARQHAALRERLVNRVYITDRGVVFVDGVNVTAFVEDDATSLESDECAEDIVDRCIFVAGGDPFVLGVSRSASRR